MEAERQPGDLILDRYLPHATSDQRAEARDALRSYAAFLLRLGDRLSLDPHESPRPDSPEPPRRRRVDAPPV